jgi:hypothetical protein
MRRLTTVVLAGMMLTATLAYGSGDLLVDGKIGVGFTSPRGRIDIGHDLGFGKGLFIGDYLEINEREVVNNALSIGFNASIAANDGTYAPGYAGGTGMVLAMASGGASDLDFWGISWGGSSTPVNLNSFTHVMRLSTNGNVGIGTTTPHQKLSITGGIGFADANDVDKKLYTPIDGVLEWMTHDAAYEHGFSISHQGARRVFLNTNGNSYIIAGNVGIGTTTPTQLLDVSGTIASNGVALTSDAKFKKNLFPIDAPLDKVLGLNGHSYEWKTDEYKEKNFPDGRHYGVIAQEIEKVLPEVVNTDAKGEKSVAYTEIIPVLIEAIKEQQKIIEAQQKQIQEIKSLIGK